MAKVPVAADDETFVTDPFVVPLIPPTPVPGSPAAGATLSIFKFKYSFRKKTFKVPCNPTHRPNMKRAHQSAATT